MYTPEDAGNYTIEVKLGSDHVAQSPYQVEIDQRLDTQNTKCFGPGLEKESVKELLPTEFTIETRDKNGKPLGKVGAGRPFVVEIEGPTGPVSATLDDHGDGTYTAKYTPKHSGPTTINVTLDQDDEKKHVADSPYKIDVQQKVDASKTLVHGPGLEDGILDTQPTYFDIETRDQDGKPLGEKGAGAPFKVDIDGPDGKIPAKVTDNGDGTYHVEYEPTKYGNHHIEVTLEDEHCANSPWDIRVDAGAYFGNSCIEKFTFVVRTKTRDNENKTTGGELEHFSVTIDGPGEKVEAKVQDIGDGTYIVSYSLPETGKYQIACKLNGKNIKGSPFTSISEE